MTLKNRKAVPRVKKRMVNVERYWPTHLIITINNEAKNEQLTA
jgi:hypothetical protein